LVPKPSSQVPEDGEAEPAEPVEQQQQGQQLGLCVDVVQLASRVVAQQQRLQGRRHRHQEGEQPTHEELLRSGW